MLRPSKPDSGVLETTKSAEILFTTLNDENSAPLHTKDLGKCSHPKAVFHRSVDEVCAILGTRLVLYFDLPILSS